MGDEMEMDPVAGVHWHGWGLGDWILFGAQTAIGTPGLLPRPFHPGIVIHDIFRLPRYYYILYIIYIL